MKKKLSPVFMALGMIAMFVSLAFSYLPAFAIGGVVFTLGEAMRGWRTA